MDTEKIDKLRRFIEDSKRIVFFGGAGVSTESGIPDFRSKDGLYNQHDVRFEKYSPEYLLSRECLEYEPAVFFEFYRQKLNTAGIRPNAAHYALAELEKRGKLTAVVTQNIDGLHQKAGSKTVYEIHGSTERNYCMRCGKRFPADHIFNSKDLIPKCDKCGGTVRCDVTLYGESLPQEAVEGAIGAISNADMLIIGGTSLSVYPAASYVDFFLGKYIVIINKTPIDYFAGKSELLEINDSIGKVLAAAVGLNGSENL